MTNEEAVKLASAMRAAGVTKFSFSGLSCELLPPLPTQMQDIVERIGEMPAKQREELLEQAKKDLEADLYGAAS